MDLKICDYYERAETPEEAEERKKREEALLKGKKKPPADKKKVAEVPASQPGTPVYGQGTCHGLHIHPSGHS